MNTLKQKNLFLVWKPFQRRAQSIARMMDLTIKYCHFHWEERSKVHKALSYIGKALESLKAMHSHKPRYVFIQLAPTPLLYIAAAYCALTGTRYVADCHNTMIYDASWIRWPFAKQLLRRSFVLMVHNEDVRGRAQKISLDPFVLRDPLPQITFNGNFRKFEGLDIQKDDYVIIPCSMDIDEPIHELFEAARMLPDIPFFVTWFADKLPFHVKARSPANLHYTGFLEEPVFNALYAHANASVVLTTREGTQPSGAAEAIALGVPLVVSDIRTTRTLYGNAPIFVDNTAPSIARGIKQSIKDYDDLSQNIVGLRLQLQIQAAGQIENIRSKLIRH